MASGSRWLCEVTDGFAGSGPCSGFLGLKTGKRAFYEFAEVKPPPSTFFFRFCSSSPGVPSTCRSHLRVPRLAVCGEAGNPEAIVLRIPSYIGLLMRSRSIRWLASFRTTSRGRTASRGRDGFAGSGPVNGLRFS